jgi:hypothetical protein
LLAVPVQYSDKLFAQRIDDEWRWHGPTSGKGYRSDPGGARSDG